MCTPPEKSGKESMQIVRIVILTLCCLVFATAKAQIDTQFSQYWALPGYYNPAAAGSSDKLNILTSTRQQWIGMPGAPQTYFVTGDMPFKFLKQNHGVGLVVTSETEGLYSHLILGAQYAFKIKLWKGVLSLGIQLGMLDERHTSQHTHERLPSSHRRRNPHYRVARHVVRYVFRGMVHPPVVLCGNFGLPPQRAIDHL